MQNQEDMLFMTCTCGCGNGFLFRHADGLIYISALTGYFSVKQRLTIAEAAAEKWRLLRKKDPWILSMSTEKDEITALLQWLRTHPCENEPTQNVSHIELQHEIIGVTQEERAEVYDIVLYSDMPWTDIIRGKQFRCGEIVLNEKGRKRMIRRLVTSLQNPVYVSL